MTHCRVEEINAGRERSLALEPCQRSSSERKYSPTSDWWKTTTPLGSILRHSLVALAVTPNPSGTSDML